MSNQLIEPSPRGLGPKGRDPLTGLVSLLAFNRLTRSMRNTTHKKCVATYQLICELKNDTKSVNGPRVNIPETVSTNEISTNQSHHIPGCKNLEALLPNTRFTTGRSRDSLLLCYPYKAGNHNHIRYINSDWQECSAWGNFKYRQQELLSMNHERIQDIQADRSGQFLLVVLSVLDSLCLHLPRGVWEWCTWYCL